MFGAKDQARDGGSQKFTVLDPATGAIGKEIKLGTENFHGPIAFSPDGANFAVGKFIGDEIEWGETEFNMHRSRRSPCGDGAITGVRKPTPGFPTFCIASFAAAGRRFAQAKRSRGRFVNREFLMVPSRGHGRSLEPMPCDFGLCQRHAARQVPRTTVEELKAEAAKVPPDDRFALAEWIERSDDVRALRRARPGKLERKIPREFTSCRASPAPRPRS